MSSIDQVVQVLNEGFEKLKENQSLLNKKRKFESETHILEWKNVERPNKILRVKIPEFKKWYNFKAQDDTTIEVSRPSIRLEKQNNHPFYLVKEVITFYDQVKVRKSSVKEKRRSTFSNFQKERRELEIQNRRSQV